MALRNPTEEETLKIIRGSLGAVVVFEHAVTDPRFLEEVISWKDILAIPPVTKVFLLTTTLAATLLVIPGSAASMNRKLFFRHLDQTEEETVGKYRELLKDLILVGEGK